MADLKDEVLGRVDLADLIGQYVSLIPAGREFKGCCPFHEEKTPSFHVNPEKGLYHCFGCKAGGNAIDFVMHMENLEFRDALEWLARRLNIDIAKYSKSRSGPVGEKERLYMLNEAATKFFRQSLRNPAGDKANSYLLKRGVTERLISEFDLGYAPREWHALADKLIEHGARSAELEKLGLIKPRKSGGGPIDQGTGRNYYDTFRDRLVFPIRSVTGRVIAFAGRALSEEDKPKYLNVTNTPLYDKSKTLYNLDRAKGRIKEEGAVVVEGYMDVIGLAGAGVDNTVATCGTALTAEHVKLLKRYTDRFFLAFDGDEAGRNAAWRAGVLFLREGLDARVVNLPAGVDPDDLVRDKGPAAWHGLLAEASSIVRFWLDYQRDKSPQADMRAQRGWIMQLAPLYRDIPDELGRQHFIREVASALYMGAGEVQGLLKGSGQAAAGGTRAPGPFKRQRYRFGNPVGPLEEAQLAFEAEDKLRHQQKLRQQSMVQGSLPTEREVIRRILTNEEFRFTYSALAEPSWFIDPQLRAAYEAVCSADDINSVVHDERFAALFAELLNTEAFKDDNEQLLVRHRNFSINRRILELTAELKAATPERQSEIFQEVMGLKSQIRPIHGIGPGGG